MLESNSILVYSQDSRLAYKSYDVVDYIKFSPTVMVVITEDSIDFIIERNEDGHKHIAVSRDIKFKEAIIYDKHLFIRRGGIFDCVDIYNNKLELVLKLHATGGGSWKYIHTFIGIPIKFMSPISIYRNKVFLEHKNSHHILDLATGKLSPTELKESNNLILKPVLEKLKIK